ncbi:hypothetical protein RintRC_5602 [Richelia intracellularis]|nr:hypothetical protein RintRC_5602 [Richelia intracellularis]
MLLYLQQKLEQLVPSESEDQDQNKQMRLVTMGIGWEKWRC